jgi:Domain of unknown function (DUF4105)
MSDKLANDKTSSSSCKRRWICVLFVFAWLISFGALLWAMGALIYDFPWPSLSKIAALGLFLGYGTIAYRMHGQWRKLLGVACLISIVLLWWFSLRPSNQRNWLQDVAEVPWAEIKGDEVTIHNVRRNDYRSESDYTTTWETRTVRLSQLTGCDIALTYWGSPWMAHPIASFQFADVDPICFSIETRKEVGEKYSAIGGIYRQYELAYIVSDERDVIRLRTNFRKGEDVYLYRTNATPEQTRDAFIEYLQAMNTLHDKPRWYNALTTNCTSSIRNQREASKRQRWDWRMLLNGKGDEMLYERNTIQHSGLSFAELKSRSCINQAAIKADKARNFSQKIREDLPFMKKH